MFNDATSFLYVVVTGNLITTGVNDEPYEERAEASNGGNLYID